ncbi:MAG: hypothetical protein EAS52_00065 [Parapedobacter sp.]|nr:MAG: hypothetical protein EAS52_00065 [Parapedobacter sp.]
MFAAIYAGFITFVYQVHYFHTYIMERHEQLPQKRKKPFRKFFITAGLGLLLVAAGMIWWNYYYVFGEGVKSGQLNYVVKKRQYFQDL